MEALAYWTAMAAVAVNAASGVLESGRRRVDLFGAIFVAFAAALGGGTLRDLPLDRPVFWVADQTYLIAAAAAALLTFVAARRARLPAELFPTRRGWPCSPCPEPRSPWPRMCPGSLPR